MSVPMNFCLRGGVRGRSWCTTSRVLCRFHQVSQFLVRQIPLTTQGPYSCIGKQLALMELRIVTARIVTQFDISFAPGENGRDLFEKTKDVFTLEVAPLRMVFTRRSD
jgi:cytochrome P450